MNRYAIVVVALIFAGVFSTSCSKPVQANETPKPIEISLASPVPTEVAESIALTSTPSVDLVPSDLKFADLANIVFVFSSGAGAWQTEVTISSDGSFKGFYSDSDMGDIGTDYPNGTQYVCYFFGKFSELKKISDFEYSMECEALSQEGVVNDVMIGDDGIRYITSEPYGFDDAKEFRLYLPGMKVSELPKGFTESVGVPGETNSENAGGLPFFGLYNIGGMEGFSG